MNEQFEFNTNDYIFRFKTRDQESNSIATFGNEKHDDLMGLYLGEDHKANEIILYKLSKLHMSSPELKHREGGPGKTFGLYWIDYNDYGEPLIASNYEVYLENDAITFKFNDNETEYVKRGDRIIYGFDYDSEPTYIRIINLTEEEYKQILETIKIKGIPIEKKKSFNKINEIDNKLKEIEKNNNIEILFSSLIGSRAWGYDTEHSDLDVRFVFKNELDSILSLNKPIDTIDILEDADDYVGYDIKKFLNLIIKQSASSYEILFSPIIDQNEIVDKLRDFANKVLIPEKMTLVYKNIIRKNINNLDNNTTKKTKKLIENLRMLATANYIEEKKEFPICNFETILSSSNNKEIKNIIEKLIELRKKGQEEINITDEMKNFFINNTTIFIDNTIDKERKEAKNMASEIYKDTILEGNYKTK